MDADRSIDKIPLSVDEIRGDEVRQKERKAIGVRNITEGLQAGKSDIIHDFFVVLITAR